MALSFPKARVACAVAARHFHAGLQMTRRSARP